jgi:SulP family sulfate permease
MRKYLAITDWLPAYRREWLAPDILAGAAVCAVLVPTAMAYAGLVGVDPIVGLFTVPAALLIYAIFGGSRLLVVGPDAAVAVLSGATIAAVVVGENAVTLELAIVLALLVGLLYLLFSFLRLGWVSDLIPDPVLKGVVEGIVWVTILKQFSKLLGLKLDGADTLFIAKIIELIQAIPSAHMLTAVVGITSVVGLLLFNKYLPRIPSAFAILVVSIILVGALDLQNHGVAVLGSTAGDAGWRGLSSWPSMGQVIGLLPGALAVMVLGSTLSLAAAKRAAEQTGERIDPDQEFLAIGAANLGAGLSGGYPVAGTLSKTAVAMQAGGKTQIGNLFTAVLAVFIIFFLVPFFSSLADASLAALVIVVMLEVSDLGYFKNLWRVRRLECAVAIAAFVGVLAYGTLSGVLIGVVLALVVLADHIRRPPTSLVGRMPNGMFAPVEENSESSEIPGLLIWRHYAPLVFLNARRLSIELRGHVKQRGNIRVVLLDAAATSGVDATATSAFVAARDELAADGVALWVANIHDKSWTRIVAALTIAGSPIPRVFSSLSDAVDAFQELGDANPEPGMR